MKKFFLLIAIMALAAVIAFLLYTPKPKPTPLDDFSAPFVFGQFRIPQDNPLTKESVELGRRLFYDVRLSGSNAFSCATCHQQKLAFSDGKKTSVGASGKPLEFNSMGLANLLWGPQHFFWDGRAGSLEEQALQPIENPDEMDQNLDALIEELEQIDDYQELFAKAYGDISKENIAKALANFQRTIISANSKYDRFLRGTASLTEEEELGRKLFVAHPDAKASLRGGNCVDCHSQFVTAGFNTQFDGFSNNGLDSEEELLAGLKTVTGKESDKGLFKVPSLRNIALTAPYMHDGRFKTLEEVLDHYNEGIKPSTTLSPLITEASNLDDPNLELSAANPPSLSLSEKEKKAIIAFLHTLTDDELIKDEKLSDPFKAANKEF